MRIAIDVRGRILAADDEECLLPHTAVMSYWAKPSCPLILYRLQSVGHLV